MFGQFLRRFLLPQVLLIVIPAAAVMIALAAGATLNVVVTIGIGAALVAIGICLLIGYFSYRAQVREISEMFTSAVPAAAPKYPQYHDSVLHDIARAFAELMNEASKDQAQLRTIISSMSDGLIATDHQQRILLTNDAASELMAFRTPDAAAARGKQLWEVVPIEEILKTVTEVSLTGQRKTVSLGPVNGKHMEVTVARLPLRPAGFVIIAHDITETMRYEELRKEFVANVSHELRTPLSVIKGYVETLQDGAMDDRQRAAQYLATVGKHTETLTNLVDDLLSLSRLDSTSAVPSPRAVHLGRIAAKVAELMEPAAQKKGHTLLLQVADGLHPVMGNPEYLERAIANLVENAIKYTRDSGLIRLIVRGENGQTIVEVVDNGIGIGAEDLPRIFERFYRAERSRSREMGGTGLGLSIVKHIVQAHGGQIEVETTPGEGSTFRMKFPIMEQSEEADANGAAA